MTYELIPLVIFLATLLLAGLVLILDATRRAVHEIRGSNHVVARRERLANSRTRSRIHSAGSMRAA